MASFRRITDRLTCRQVLNIMVIFGFMLNYMLRVNLTIAIVAMVYPKNSSHSNSTEISHECSGIATIVNITQIQNEKLTTDVNDSNLASSLLREGRPQTKYHWDESQANFVLGAFFWGYICTELPGGRLAEVVGAKRVFGYSMLIASVLTLLTPIAATFGYKAAAGLRVVLGFMLGATWPSILPLASVWIPPMERSKFMSNMIASSLGAAITMPICGFLIASLGWESVFYVTGGLSFVWSIVWLVVIFDSPAQHPRITDNERRYIEEAIGNTSSKKVHAVPWKSIFTSMPVWSIVIIHCCNVFGFFTVINQLPTYMKYILDFNIKENGLLSSLPYIGKYLFALLSAYLGDYLRRTNKLSVTAIRKLFSGICVLTPGFCMILLSQFGCDRVVAVAIFTVALTINGAVTAGFLGNGLDIAPNFSGTIFGLANTLSSFGGYLSTVMVGSLTLGNQTYHQWSIIFWILAGIYIFGACVYLIFGTGELQKWNNPDGEHSRKKIELSDIKNEEEATSLNEKL
ncbi:sialin [Chelonus insularis]|uniref:sialin n=1 Tax=Chelonus insularis TaxID=460826 RepID=UPI00158DF3E2|nr:sialin [Chelonus insularis]